MCNDYNVLTVVGPSMNVDLVLGYLRYHRRDPQHELFNHKDHVLPCYQQ